MTTIEERYKKKDLRDHILTRPDSYIGSVKSVTDSVFVPEKDGMVKKVITYTPGLYKIFDEILVNAMDHSINDVSVTQIKVNIDNNEISVFNDGTGISIEMHKEHKVYVPELIFGHLLTSSNFNDDEERITGGRNGFGAKLSNIYSKKFTLETVSKGKKYLQIFSNNMSEKTEPKITQVKSKEYTKVTFEPDLEKFGMKKLDKDILYLFKKRVYDCSACTSKGVSVYYNGELVKHKTFEKYVDLYIGNKKEQQRVYQTNGNWELVCSPSPDDKFEQVSFVNGIWTIQGGKHIDYIQNQISKKLSELIQSKNKNLNVKQNYIKDRLFIFLKSTVINPTFSSQTKETLTTNVKDFGFKFDVSDEFIVKLAKTGISEEIIAFAKHKETRNLKATDGKKKSRVKVSKLDDANWAGTSKSEQCTLILTEGDSAKTFAISGLTVVGRDAYGVFPLRGKLLNVRDATTKKITENKEITDLKTILGLEQGKVYSSLSDLRYGRVMILTDADVDGHHITGLIMNLFHSSWPSLMKFDNFIVSMKTPVVKISKGNVIHEFYTNTDYVKWQKNNPIKGWFVKYYKGLGTSSSKEAKEYFKNLNKSVVTYKWDKHTDKFMKMAFEKKQTDNRKKWIGTFDPKETEEIDDKVIPYSEFIDKELIHFSVSDLQRSIPSICDGLKPSQRKVIFYMLKKNITKEIKVSQLSGYISAETSYHHGPASMEGTIISMAQDFAGSNNINLLEPIGQFGCLDPETDILLWDSSIKKAKDITMGDTLVGDDGMPRKILQMTSGEDDMYKVTLFNGLEYTVNTEHILTLKFSKHKNLRWNIDSKSWVVTYFNTKKVIEKTFRTIDSSCINYNNYNKIHDTKNQAYNKAVEYLNNISDNDIFDIKVTDYLKLSKYNQRYFKSFTLQESIKWDKRSVPIPPYILGIWLGDGLSDGRGISSIDSEHLKELVKYIDSIHAELVHTKNKDGHENCHYGIKKKGSGFRKPIGKEKQPSCIGCLTSSKKLPICNFVYEFTETNQKDYCLGFYKNGIKRNDLNPFVKILKENDLFKNKHIPNEYIINSVENRLELLAGIIDTDGCVKYSNGVPRIEITQCFKLRDKLILQIQFIANSLGYNTTYSRSGTLSVLSIYGNNLDLIPMRINRKIIKPYFKKRNTSYKNFKLDFLGSGKFIGWQVDQNERFLLGNFVVTHNSRLQGGKDSASSRYINTRLANSSKYLFPDSDNGILNYLEDDGISIEPEWYIPVLPLVLINGAEGIGTGYSSFIPSYNKKDIIKNLTRLMNNEQMIEMSPYYEKFKGEIEKINDTTYISKGVYKKTGKNSIEITELPVGRWTEDYKEFLESEEKYIKDFQNYSTEDVVRFKVDFKPGILENLDIEKELRLTKQFSINNMNLFNKEGKITKYQSPLDILKDYYSVRLEYYSKRKQNLLILYKKQFDIAEARVRFIMGIIDKRIIVFKKTKVEIESQLIELQFPKFGENEPPNYKYLLEMPVSSFSQEKINELTKLQKDKKIQLKTLEETEIEDLWIEDLDNYIKKFVST